MYEENSFVNFVVVKRFPKNDITSSTRIGIWFTRPKTQYNSSPVAEWQWTTCQMVNEIMLWIASQVVFKSRYSISVYPLFCATYNDQVYRTR